MKISTQKEKTTKIFAFSKIGVFAASLLVTASAIYLYSPVVGSHAEENANLKVQATVNPVASLTLDVSNLSFAITPTTSGVFESKPVNATVNTNSTGGYELYFSSIDNETGMKNVDENVSSEITSDFSGMVTSEGMPANTWGYSLNNTDFSKIPALNSQATIKNIDHYPGTNERTTTINIGTKISSSLPSGKYSKDVIFSVLVHDTPASISSISNMQEMTTEACANTAVGDSAVLTDIRNNKSYSVAKLRDGNCWMTQDLSIENKTLTSADTNLPDGETYVLPASESAWPYEQRDGTPHVYIEDTYGGHYNYFAATAGWTSGGDAPKDICPKGWRLPTGTGSKSGVSEYDNLTDEYGRYTLNLVTEQPHFNISGYVGTSYYNNGSGAYYWSSTSSDIYQASSFVLYQTDTGGSAVGYTGYGTYYGASLRCIAK